MTAAERARLVALLLSVSFLFSTVASAQPRSVLVLPWSLADANGPTLAAHAETVAGAVPTGELSALSIADARARFEEHGSSEPHAMSDGDLDRWLALSRQAVRQLAQADYASAARTLREAQALSEPAAAELNREETRARQVLDTCLFDVRALIETHDPRADARALECRRLVPRIAPSPYQHTPEVVALMASVDRRLAASVPGSLRLESDPSGCSVRLNGIPLGATPFVSEDLATGEYRAQVECDGDTAPARVHRIRLGEGTTLVRVDARFDAAVRTDVALRLVYASVADADAQRRSDAIAVATTVGAAEVWVLGVDAADADVIAIDRIAVATGDVVATVRARVGDSPSSVAALARGESVDRTGATPVSIAPPGVASAPAPMAASPALASHSRADWEIGVGIGLGALGVGGYVISFALLDTELGYARLTTSDPTDPSYLQRRAAWTQWELPSQLAGWLGGALVTAALPFVMSDEVGVPWWSWVIGAVGAVTIVTGVAISATASTCGANGAPDAGCTGGTAIADAGSTIASLGAPLLAVPLVHLVRSAIDGDDVLVTPSASATGASLSVGGEW